MQNVCPAPWEEFWPSQSNLWEPKQGSDVRWNFEKWLIAKDGNIVIFLKTWYVCISIHYIPPIICLVYLLFSSTGSPFRRYHSYTEPYNLEQDVKYLLDQADEPSKEGSALDYYEKRRKPKNFLVNVDGTLTLEEMN